jgi:acyl carrier protein
MQQDTVLAGLTEVLGDVAGVDPADVTPEATFGQDLGIDSLTLAEVVVAAEDRFGLIINDDDWSRFVTAGDVIAYIERAGMIAPAGPVRADTTKN